MKKKIKDYSYKGVSIASSNQPVSSLVLETEDGKEIICPNGDYTINVTSLQIMAYCDVSPTRLDDIIDQSINITMHKGNYFPTNKVCMLGKKLLKTSDWFEEKQKRGNQEMNEQYVIGGGGPDSGTGNKQNSKINQGEEAEI